MLDIIKAYENYLTKVKKASSNTISSYMRDIRQFDEWLDVDVLEASQLNISDYLRYMEEDGRSAATISRTLASLKNALCVTILILFGPSPTLTATSTALIV